MFGAKLRDPINIVITLNCSMNRARFVAVSKKSCAESFTRLIPVSLIRQNAREK